jgi:hypothetical protein
VTSRRERCNTTFQYVVFRTNTTNRAPSPHHTERQRLSDTGRYVGTPRRWPCGHPELWPSQACAPHRAQHRGPPISPSHSINPTLRRTWYNFGRIRLLGISFRCLPPSCRAAFGPPMAPWYPPTPFILPLVHRQVRVLVCRISEIHPLFSTRRICL